MARRKHDDTTKPRPVRYSKTIGVYPVANYPRLCDTHAEARGLGGLARTGVAAAREGETCEDCAAQRLLDAVAATR